MMELTCAHIFVLFCVVSATPHGYGTKGGASAKAEASATAGAFGDIRGLPLNIPSGPGFSGSYSKSSSSSFSSASSSASSSSSSYSYSGSGSAGIPGFGANSVAGANGLIGIKELAGINGQAGANGYTGINSNAGANGIGGTNGFAGAHSVAGANAIAGSYGLTGTNSITGSNGLTAANGLSESTTGCSSGTCSINKADESPSLHGSNGAPAGTDHGYNGANAAAGSKATADTYDLTKGGHIICNGNDCSYPSSGCVGPDCLNDCTSGQCSFGSLNKNEGCSSGKCGHVLQPEPASSGYQSPTPCTSGQCGLNVQPSLPTIPTYGSNDIPAKKYDGTSASGSKGHHGNTAFTGHQGTLPDSSSESSEEKKYPQNDSGHLDKHSLVQPKCDTPNCKGHDYTGPASIDSGLPIGHTKPATYLTTPKVNCNSPTCQPDLNVGVGKPSSYHVPLHTTLDVPKQELSCYNGNCGNNQFNNAYNTQPVSCTSPNCAKQPAFSTTSDCKSPHCAPNYAFAPSGSGNGLIYQPGLPSSASIPTKPNYASPVLPTFNPSHGHIGPGCSTPDCTGHTNAGHDTGAHSQSGYFPTSPKPVIPNYSTPVLIPSTPTFEHTQYIPSNTDNYGGVSGTKVITSGHKPSTGGYGQGFGGPSGILKPNEFSVPTTTHVLVPAHTGPPSANKPSIGASPSAEELPPYTGGFGGPQGLLKPNEFDIKHPSTILNTSASNVSPSERDHPTYTGGFGAPSGLLKPTQVSSSYNTGITTNSNLGSFGTTSPHTSVTSPIQKVTTHHGTYGVPPGSLQPGNTPNVGVTPVIHVGSPIVLQPIPAGYVTHQTPLSPSGGFIAPIGSMQPNTYFSNNPANAPNVGSGHVDAHGHHGHTQVTNGESVADKNLPTYTGGFGGPTGVLNTNSYKESSVGYNNEGKPTGTKPTACSSGICDVKSSNAVAVAKADAVAYTGGFGGPSGLLTPHDSGKLDSKLLPNTQFGLNHGATDHSKTDSSGKGHGESDKALSHGTYSQSGTVAQANAAAQASATAGATSGSFGSNIAYSNGQAGAHDAGDKLGNGCGGGCGGGGQYGGGSNFGSSTALSAAKAGVINGSESGLHGNDASAKSVASAVSGARAFGGAGSYASSSASAQASAGYATKGGYGK